LFIAATLATVGVGCSVSTHQTETTRLSRLTTDDGLGGLWVSSEPARPEGELRYTERGNDTGDLWMKTGAEGKPEGVVERPTPRLDLAMKLMYPQPTAVSAHARNQARAFQ
jgi:hypothetical protein